MALTENVHNGEFIYSEAPGTRSRTAITLLSGQVYAAGAVLGKITCGAATAVATGGNTGNGTCSAVANTTAVQVGAYTVIFIAATKFEVYDPSGKLVGAGATGVAFSNQIGFTITAGGTAFVAGDSFTITVAAGSGKYTLITSTATDGSAVAAGININRVDATGGDKPGVALTVAAEVSTDNLSFGALTGSLTSGQILAAVNQLAALGIYLRNTL